jgi:hypothetical protein
MKRTRTWRTTFGRPCESTPSAMTIDGKLMEAHSSTETRNFQYLSPKKYREANTMIRLVLRNLGGETYINAGQWIEKFKDLSMRPTLGTELSKDGPTRPIFEVSGDVPTGSTVGTEFSEDTSESGPLSPSLSHSSSGSTVKG